MLRRYLIVNGLSTAALYLAIMAFAPAHSVTAAFTQVFHGYVSEDAMLGPVFNRVIVVGAEMLGFN